MTHGLTDRPTFFNASDTQDGARSRRRGNDRVSAEGILTFDTRDNTAKKLFPDKRDLQNDMGSMLDHGVSIANTVLGILLVWLVKQRSYKIVFLLVQLAFATFVVYRVKNGYQETSVDKVFNMLMIFILTLILILHNEPSTSDTSSVLGARLVAHLESEENILRDGEHIIVTRSLPSTSQQLCTEGVWDIVLTSGGASSEKHFVQIHTKFEHRGGNTYFISKDEYIAKVICKESVSPAAETKNATLIFPDPVTTATTTATTAN